MSFIFSYFDDLKIKNWNDAIREESNHENEIIGSKLSPILFPFDLLLKIFCYKKPNFVLFRYLNDSPNLFKSLARFFSEFLVICICLSLNIKIMWLIHNIDKESAENYPYLTKLRRKILRRFTCSFFVTHDFLISYASEILYIDQSKIKVACFGEEINKSKISNHIPISYLDEWSSDCRLGMWIGNHDAKKTIGLDVIGSIIASDKDKTFKFILIGIPKEIIHKRLITVFNLSNKILSERLFIIPTESPFPTNCWKEHIDFLIKPLDDISLPLAYFYSAYTGIPIIGFENNLVTKVAQFDRVGISLSETNTANQLKKDLQEKKLCFDEFSAKYSWKIGAKNLFGVE